MNPVTVVTTTDGSHTILDARLQVHYHSMHGAITESRYVFIGAGLEYVGHDLEQINILEVGFGTGLNAFLTYLYCREHTYRSISYHGIEKYPIDAETAGMLNYPSLLHAIDSQNIFLSMHEVSDFRTENFHFTRQTADVCDILLQPVYHLIYFDAFAPEAQPELWDLPMLEKLYNSVLAGGVLVTFCAKGQFKRNLRCVGFEVEALPGPPGKREMVRATRW